MSKKIEREIRNIRLDRIILPEYGDLRSWRDEAFKEKLGISLARDGIFDLPIVRLCADRPDFYVIVDGWSRVEQLRVLGDVSTDCEVVSVDGAKAIIFGLMSNMIRKRHDSIGMAKAFVLLHDEFKMRYKDIAELFDYTPQWVSVIVGLLKLPRDVQENVAKQNITIKEASQMLPSRGSSEVMDGEPDKRRMCHFCSSNVEPHEIDLLLICNRCKSKLRGVLKDTEKEIKDALRAADKARELAKEGQKYLNVE